MQLGFKIMSSHRITFNGYLQFYYIRIFKNGSNHFLCALYACVRQLQKMPWRYATVKALCRRLTPEIKHSIRQPGQATQLHFLTGLCNVIHGFHSKFQNINQKDTKTQRFGCCISYGGLCCNALDGRCCASFHKIPR